MRKGKPRSCGKCSDNMASDGGRGIRPSGAPWPLLVWGIFVGIYPEEFSLSDEMEFKMELKMWVSKMRRNETFSKL